MLYLFEAQNHIIACIIARQPQLYWLVQAWMNDPEYLNMFQLS